MRVPPTRLIAVFISVVLAFLLADASRGAVLFTPEKLDALRQRIAANTEPTASAWAVVQANANAALTFQPTVPDVWSVPAYYSNPERHESAKASLRDSADAAYVLALAWQMTQNVAYAEASARIILAWAAIAELSTTEDSTLSFSYHFPPLIFAAELLRGSPAWSAANEQTFRTFLTERALALNTMSSNNNWGNWGLVLYSAIAAYTDDQAGLDTAEARWKYFIGSQIAADGHMDAEVGRNGGRSGMWYSHFSLFPQTIAAEILRVQGRDLFNYTTNGRNLRLAYDRIAPWALQPGLFPYYSGDPVNLHSSDYVSYFEILLPRWPNTDARMLVESRRPMTAEHGLPYLTFTHGEQFEGPSPGLGNVAPVITSGPTVSANPVNGTAISVVVGATDADQDPLVYTWKSSPSGVSFSSAGNAPTATFNEAGNYTLSIYVSDGRGGGAYGAIPVTVNQTATELRISP